MRIRIGFHRLVECFEYKKVVIAIADNKGYDAPIVKIQNGTKVDFVCFRTFVPFEFRYVSKPLFIGPLCMEFAIQYIFSNVLGIL